MAVSDYKNSFLTIKGMSSSYHFPPPTPKLAPHFPGSPNGRQRTEDLPPRPSPRIFLIFISTKFQLDYYHYNILPFFSSSFKSFHLFSFPLFKTN